MPFHPHQRLSRRRRQALALQSGDHCWSVYHPDPDQPIVIAEFADAAMLAAEIGQLPVRHEAVVLLDARRRVTAILLDPPAEVGLLVGLAQLPGVETPFCQTLCLVLDDKVRGGPASDDDSRGYHALRRAHMAQGLLLLDVLITDGDVVRSLAIGCDPDPVWFDQFTPLADDDTDDDATDDATDGDTDGDAGSDSAA